MPILNTIKGIGEAAANAVTGQAAAIPADVIANTLSLYNQTQKDVPGYVPYDTSKVQQLIKQQYTYEPKTLEGQAAQYALGKAGEATGIPQASQWAGQQVTNLTGNPTLGQTVTDIAPYAVGGTVGRAIGDIKGGFQKGYNATPPQMVAPPSLLNPPGIVWDVSGVTKLPDVIPMNRKLNSYIPTDLSPDEAQVYVNDWHRQDAKINGPRAEPVATLEKTMVLPSLSPEQSEAVGATLQKIKDMPPSQSYSQAVGYYQSERARRGLPEIPDELAGQHLGQILYEKILADQRVNPDIVKPGKSFTGRYEQHPTVPGALVVEPFTDETNPAAVWSIKKKRSAVVKKYFSTEP